VKPILQKALDNLPRAFRFFAVTMWLWDVKLLIRVPLPWSVVVGAVAVTLYVTFAD
jgi:hypothetical protein